MTKRTISESQDLMLRLAIDGLSEYLKFGDPEKVEDVIIETPGKVMCFDIDMKISAGSQHCFFSFMPSVNSISDLWCFLEHMIVHPSWPSVYSSEQEGPEAIFFAKPNGDNIILTVLEEGWYEFSLPMDEKTPYNKVYNDYFSVKLNIDCPRKKFIQAMYKALTTIEYPTGSEDDIEHQLWNGAQKDSEIVRKYCEK